MANHIPAPSPAPVPGIPEMPAPSINSLCHLYHRTSNNTIPHCMRASLPWSPPLHRQRPHPPDNYYTPDRRYCHPGHRRHRFSAQTAYSDTHTYVHTQPVPSVPAADNLTASHWLPQPEDTAPAAIRLRAGFHLPPHIKKVAPCIVADLPPGSALATSRCRFLPAWKYRNTHRRKARMR